MGENTSCLSVFVEVTVSVLSRGKVLGCSFPDSVWSNLPLFLPFPFMTLQSGFRPTGRDACASAKQPGPLRGWISMQGAFSWIHVYSGKEPLEVMTCLNTRKVYMGCQLILDNSWKIVKHGLKSSAIFQHGTLIWVISLPIVADCVAGFLHLELQSPLSTGTPCFGFPRCCRESR